MNWKNVNLSDNYERDQNIIEPLSFDTLLLELNCNVAKENLTEAEVIRQFEIDLNQRVNESKEVFKNNLKNILHEAKR